MSAANHLVPADLSKILYSILRWTQRPLAACYGSNAQHVALKVGICVSGGPDSMALAYLLYNMRHPHDSSVKAFDTHAFIIDHGMRSESTKEANEVRDNLSLLGIDSNILNMSSVEKSVSSKDLVSFQNKKNETYARAFRYQAIIAAARQKSIYKLFLGHHYDDQMETLLMKLVTQRRLALSALQGMSLVAPAPYSILTSAFHTTKVKCVGEHLNELDTAVIHCDQSPAIQLLRPLLGFSKAQLIATCKYFGIPFVSDKTNLDPTYTLRNAVRYLRSHVRLPRALQNPSLEDLRNRAVQNAEQEKQAGEAFNAMITINELRQESGTAKITIQKTRIDTSTRYLLGAGVALARFCDFASPMNKDLLPSKLSPDVVGSILGLTGHPRNNSSRLRNGTEPHYQALKVDFRIVTQVDAKERSNLRSLQISRQPMRKSEVLANTHTITFRLSSADHDQHSNWIHWDNRFWIRAKLEESTTFDRIDLTLRPYQPEDILNVREILRETKRKELFEQRLKRCAPGHVKYTMPVFVLNGNIVAFPTCDIQLVDLLPFSWEAASSQPQRAVDFFRSRTC